jgi:hypothetical protein
LHIINIYIKTNIIKNLENFQIIFKSGRDITVLYGKCDFFKNMASAVPFSFEERHAGSCCLQNRVVKT